jgi:hypothetical protein
MAEGSLPISSTEGEEMARKIGALSYFEISSRTNVGVQDLMQDVARTHLNQLKKKHFQKKEASKDCVLL